MGSFFSRFLKPIVSRARSALGARSRHAPATHPTLTAAPTRETSAPSTAAGWLKFTEAYLDAGASLSSTTNLATHLSDEELDSLTRFKIIFMSIDTFDVSLKKPRTVDARLVFYNFHRIRAYALARKRPLPEFGWSVTLSTAAIAIVEGLLPLARRYGVKYIFFGEFASFDDLQHTHQHLLELDGEKFDSAVATLDRVLAYCSQVGIQAHTPWKERLDRKRRARERAAPEQNESGIGAVQWTA